MGGLKLLAPVLFFHRGQGERGRIQADDFQIDAAIRADDDLTLDDIVEGDLSITFGTMGGYICRHFLLQSKSVKIKKPSGRRAFGYTWYVLTFIIVYRSAI